MSFIPFIIIIKKFQLLKYIKYYYILLCKSLNSNFTQQVINITKPFKLKSLFLDESFKIDESLKFLIQKSGNYLENFGITSNGLQKLFESIIKYWTDSSF